jgi:hypothetical protein
LSNEEAVLTFLGTIRLLFFTTQTAKPHNHVVVNTIVNTVVNTAFFSSLPGAQRKKL